MKLRQQLGNEYDTKLKVVENKAKDLWENGPVHHPYYTLHGIKHSDAVISILDRLVIGLSPEDQLDEVEVFCLLSAAYLHDVGMQCKYPDDKTRIESISKLKNKPYALEDLIRDEHHLRSGRYIKENYKVLGLDHIEAECVRLISEGHRRVNLHSNDYDSQAVGLKRVRVRLLSSFLRLADELDIDYRRAPETLYEILKEDMPDFSRLQWLKHHYTSGLIIEPILKESKKAVSIEINCHYPRKEEGEEVTEVLILKPIREKVDELQTMFLKYGLELDLVHKVKINTDLKEIPPHLLKDIFDQKIYYHDDLLEKYTTLEKAYDFLKQENSSLDEEKPEFQNIHKFLDRLNLYLDTDLTVIKKLYYNSCWKLGIAYNDYSDDKITYLLYPINYNKNGLQIREISNKLKDDLRKELGSCFVKVIYSNNPIHCQPEKYAKELVVEKVTEICDKKLLPLNNVTLFREVIFKVIDRLHDCLGLEVKNNYTIEEIKYSFYIYLPIWVDEVLTDKNINLGHHPFFSPYIDLTLLLTQLKEENVEKLDKKVKERVKNYQFNKRKFFLRNNKFPLKFVLDFLESSHFNELTEINRLYVPPNFTRPTNDTCIWSFYSPEELLRNVMIFFKEFPDVYDTTVNNCFPKLKSKISFFNDFDTLIVVIEAHDSYSNSDTGPTMECYYLKSEDANPEREVKFYMKGREYIPINREVDFKTKLCIDGKPYTVMYKSYGGLDFIFQDLPMFEYLYKTLREKMDYFFQSNE